MSYYVHTPLIALFINLALVFLVLRRNHRSSQHRVFSLFLLSMALWGLTIFGMRSSSDLDSALKWERAVIALGPWTSVFFYHFSLLFTRIKPRKWLIPGAYSLCILLSFLAPTELVVGHMRPGPYGYAPVMGVLAFPIAFTVYLFVILGLSNLLRFYRTSSSTDGRNQAVYIIAGAACALLGGAADIIHSFELPVPPLGIVGNILFASLATVAILKYKLLDIQVVIRKGLAYTLISGLVVSIYVLAVFLVSGVLQWQKIGLAFVVVVTLVIAIALQPMLRWVQRVVDRWFYRERYNQLRALEDFSQQNHDVTNLDRLSSSLVSLVTLALRSRSVCLLMPHGKKGDFTVTASSGLAAPPQQASLRGNSPVIRWLRAQNGFLARKDMEIIPKLQALSAKDRDTLDQLGTDLLVALKSTHDLAGILLLAPKLSGETYSADDKRVLTVMSRQVSAALDNARLYNEAQRALQDLHKTQDQLLRTERLRAIGEVAAGVGHDLRNLLTVVVGRAQLALGRGNYYDEKLRDDLELIKEAALDGAQVLNRMQNFTKVSSAHDFSPVNLNELLLESLQMLEPRLLQKRETENANIDVILNLRDIELVKGSPSELREMLTNIVINAIEAMPRGGKLVVESGQKSSVVVITIEDTGVGMTGKVRKRIFEPFYSTKGSQGVGLGLSIAYGTAKKHGGDIQVSSRFGEGSTFTIKLPVTRQRGCRKLVRSEVSGVARQARALVIDDDKRVGGVLAEILESGGYAVDVAASAKEGLALAQSKDYTVMITDLGMPGMSGRDIAKAVNAVKPEMPIFLVTGWDIQVQPSELIDLGISGIIVKPFTRTNILTQIKNAMK